MDLTFKSQLLCLTYLIHWIKKEANVIISIDAGKALDKIQCPLMNLWKHLSKLGVKRNLLNLLEGSYQKRHFYFNIALEIFARTTWQEEKMKFINIRKGGKNVIVWRLHNCIHRKCKRIYQILELISDLSQIIIWPLTHKN